MTSPQQERPSERSESLISSFRCFLRDLLDQSNKDTSRRQSEDCIGEQEAEALRDLHKSSSSRLSAASNAFSDGNDTLDGIASDLDEDCRPIGHSEAPQRSPDCGKAWATSREEESECSKCSAEWSVYSRRNFSRSSTLSSASWDVLSVSSSKSKNKILSLASAVTLPNSRGNRPKKLILAQLKAWDDCWINEFGPLYNGKLIFCSITLHLC